MSDYLEEAMNYVPGGYEQAWEKEPHYGYEPPRDEGNRFASREFEAPDSSRSSTKDEMGIMYNNGIPGMDGGGNSNWFSAGTPWGSGDEGSDFGKGSGGGSGVYGRSGYGGGGSSSSVTTFLNEAVTRSMTPTKALPTMGALPTMPTYDENKVRGLTQKYAGSGINKMRDAVSEAFTRGTSIDNPYLRKSLMKSTLEGFGSGLGNVVSSAEGRARNAYDTEFKGKMTEYENEVDRQKAVFQAAMQDYLNTMTTTTTSSRGNPAQAATSSTAPVDDTFNRVKAANANILRLAHM